MSEREAFEAWWKIVPIHRPLAHLDAWAAWNARAAIEAQRVPDVRREALMDVIRRLNGNPYSLTKYECIDEIEAMLSCAPPVAQPAERKPPMEPAQRVAIVKEWRESSHLENINDLICLVEKFHGIGD